MIHFKYISSVTESELNNSVTIPCTDEEGFSCILIKNARNKVLMNGYSTDNLDVKINRVLLRNGKEYYVHIIRSKKTDVYSKNQFDIIYEYIFKKIDNPIDDKDISGLITSIEDFFKTTPEKDTKKIQTGVFGELFTINYLYSLGYTEIINKYHKNFYSKHDVEINSKTRMEIKASLSEKRVHHFSHNQIMRKDVNVLVSSVLLEEAKEGKSLKSLFEDVIQLFSDPDSILALKKLMVRCGLNDEYDGMSFAYEKAFSDIRFYDAKYLPKIDQESFEGVSNIEYDVDCSNCTYFNTEDLLVFLHLM